MGASGDHQWQPAVGSRVEARYGAWQRSDGGCSRGTATAVCGCSPRIGARGRWSCFSVPRGCGVLRRRCSTSRASRGAPFFVASALNGGGRRTRRRTLRRTGRRSKRGLSFFRRNNKTRDETKEVCYWCQREWEVFWKELRQDVNAFFLAQPVRLFHVAAAGGLQGLCQSIRWCRARSAPRDSSPRHLPSPPGLPRQSERCRRP